MPTNKELQDQLAKLQLENDELKFKLEEKPEAAPEAPQSVNTSLSFRNQVWEIALTASMKACLERSVGVLHDPLRLGKELDTCLYVADLAADRAVLHEEKLQEKSAARIEAEGNKTLKELLNPVVETTTDTGLRNVIEEVANSRNPSKKD